MRARYRFRPARTNPAGRRNVIVLKVRSAVRRFKGRVLARLSNWRTLPSLRGVPDKTHTVTWKAGQPTQREEVGSCRQSLPADRKGDGIPCRARCIVESERGFEP